jgi:hypothetical protein
MRKDTDKKLSIITVCLDSEISVLNTYESLRPQLTNQVEWLIKTSSYRPDPRIQGLANGASIKLVNMPDGGIYQALNQAIAQIDGKYCWVIGAGDRATENSVGIVVNAIAQIEQTPNIKSICFSIYHKKLNAIIRADPVGFKQNMTCPHPGAILQSELVQQLGGYDERYEIAGDYDLMLRYFSHWPNIAVAGNAIVEFEGGGISETRHGEAALESDLSRERFKRYSKQL